MFQLPSLTYAYNALLPYIDEETMRIHHDKHHQTYIDNLNKALTDFPELASKTIEELLSNTEALPDKCKVAVVNNGGGHLNHTLFWTFLSERHDQKPGVELEKALNSSFGSIDEFKTQFEDSGIKRFGSGWAWLIVDTDKTLKIISTQNQDNPISQGSIPILGVDVWEHAYYLKYQNKRAEYLKNFWNVVNFERVEELYKKAIL